MEPRKKKARAVKGTAISDGSSSDSEDSDSSETDGGLVLVQRGRSEGVGSGAEPEEDGSAEEFQRKKKKMRITSDGVAAAGVATKRVFDEDGAAVVRFRWAVLVKLLGFLLNRESLKIPVVSCLDEFLLQTRGSALRE